MKKYNSKKNKLFNFKKNSFLITFSSINALVINSINAQYNTPYPEPNYVNNQNINQTLDRLDNNLDYLKNATEMNQDRISKLSNRVANLERNKPNYGENPNYGNVNNQNIFYYKVLKGDTIYSIAKKYRHIGVTQDTIYRYNPKLADPNQYLIIGSLIKLPRNSSSTTTNNNYYGGSNNQPSNNVPYGKDGIYEDTGSVYYSPQKAQSYNYYSASEVYTVKKGETLYKIARKHNLAAQDIIEFNNLKKPYNLLIGQKLKLPYGKQGNDEFTNSNNSSGHKTYVVKKGDNLYKIARKYNTTQRILESYNNLQGKFIYPGQKIKIPTNVKGQHSSINSESYNLSNVANSNHKVYKVKKGDNLYKISLNYGLTEKFIMEYNGLKNNIIYPGQKIKIPNNSELYIDEELQKHISLKNKKNLQAKVQKKKGYRVKKNLKNNSTLSAKSKNNQKKDKHNKLEKVYYLLKKNEKLADVAKLFYISENELLKFNKLSKNSILNKGQKIFIPLQTKNISENIELNRYLYKQNIAKKKLRRSADLKLVSSLQEKKEKIQYKVKKVNISKNLVTLANNKNNKSNASKIKKRYEVKKSKTISNVDLSSNKEVKKSKKLDKKLTKKDIPNPILVKKTINLKKEIQKEIHIKPVIVDKKESKVLSKVKTNVIKNLSTEKKYILEDKSLKLVKDFKIKKPKKDEKTKEKIKLARLEDKSNKVLFNDGLGLDFTLSDLHSSPSFRRSYYASINKLKIDNTLNNKTKKNKPLKSEKNQEDSKSSKDKYIDYFVENSDTITKISKDFNVKPDIIREINNLGENAPLIIGTRLLIPKN